MPAITGPDNKEMFTTPRYLTALTFFWDTDGELDPNRSFPESDITAYGEEHGVHDLHEEVFALAEQDIVYSVYTAVDNMQKFGVSPEYSDDIEVLGELVDTKYEGIVGWFVDDFSETDRMYLEENTELIELLE